MFILLFSLLTQARTAEFCADKSVPIAYAAVINDAMAYWRGAASYNGPCIGLANEIPIVWLNNWDAESTAVAYTYYSPPRIHIRGLWHWTIKACGEPTKLQFQLILAHEIGHVLRGRAHTKTGIMRPLFSPSEYLDNTCNQ